MQADSCNSRFQPAPEWLVSTPIAAQMWNCQAQDDTPCPASPTALWFCSEEREAQLLVIIPLTGGGPWSCYNLFSQINFPWQINYLNKKKSEEKIWDDAFFSLKALFVGDILYKTKLTVHFAQGQYSWHFTKIALLLRFTIGDVCCKLRRHVSAEGERVCFS